jgi:regulator of RNase E activity RraB
VENQGIDISLLSSSLIKVTCKGLEFIVEFDGKKPKKTFDQIMKQIEVVNLGLTNEEKVELLKRYNALISSLLAKKDNPSEPQYDFGQVQAQPILDKPLEELHPAIGLTNKFAYIGVLLPSLVTKDEKGEQKTYFREMPYIVTSERKLIPLTPEALQPIGFKMAYTPTIIKGKWNEKGIKEYLDGKSVDPAQLYDKIRAIFQKYIEIEPKYYDLLTLWTIGTYCFHLFTGYPYMFIMGVKGCGKTKLLNVISALGFNAIHSSNMTASVLFRLIQGGRCTLLIDENEQLKNPDRLQDFRSMLLAGYKKGALVYRSEKTATEKFEPVGYEVYAPKIMANITGLEDVLEDRCITIIMKRGLNQEIINTEVDELDPIWEEIRNELHIFYLERASELKALKEELEETEFLTGINARDRELWKPLYILAKFFDKFSVVSVVSVVSVGLTEEEKKKFPHEKISFSYTLRTTQTTQTTQTTLSRLIEALALENAESKDVEDRAETADVLLIQALLALVDKDDYYSLNMIKSKFSTFFDSEESWITNKWLGRALKRLGFQEKRRVGSGMEYHLTPDKVKDMAARLGIQIEDADDKNSVDPSLKSHTQHTQHTQNHQIDDGSDGGLSVCSQSTDTQHTQPPPDLKTLEIPPNLEIEVHRLDPQDFVKTSCAYCNQDTTIVAYLGSWPICFDCLRQQLEEARKRWQS